MDDHDPTGPPSADPGHPASHALRALRDQLDSLEHLIEPGWRAPIAATRQLEPAWRRATQGEARPPVSVLVAVAIGLQVVLPDRFVFKPTWLLPALEGALLVGLTAANPKRIVRPSRLLRQASLALIAIISAANAWSAAELVKGIIVGDGGSDAKTLLGSGAAIYLTNIVVFGLWYWELDRGGPVARAQGGRRYPDFMFVQMDKTDMAPPDWKPTFFDYLWLSFTNATAFSPTDTMPLSRPAKAIMLAQSAVSLITVALVIARAVNIFK